MRNPNILTHHFYKLMDSSLDNIWLKSNTGNILSKDGNASSNSTKIYNGCFSLDPQEVGPRIERPSAPISFTSRIPNISVFLNKNNMFPIQ